MVSRSSIAAPGGAVLFWLVAPTWALAAESPAPETPLSPVVITATRIPTTLDQIASSLTLITDLDIQANQQRTLPDVLAEAPGLSVVQTGGPGGQTSVFIRGANANHTKVLIDGIDAVDPSEGAFDFGQTLTGDLARVEVLRGPQSSLYGSDALGGVINIVTRAGAGPPRLTATLEGGSFKTLNETGTLSGSTRGLSYAFTVQHALSGDTPVTPLELLAPGETRIGDRYDNLTLSTKLGLAVTKDLGLGLVVRYLDADLRTTGENYDLYPAPNIPDAAQTDQKSRQLFTRGEARLDLFGGALRNVLGLGYTDYHTAIVAPDDGFGPPPPTINDGDRVKVDDQGTLTLDARDTLLFGAEAEKERLLGPNGGPSKGSQAGFAEVQSHPFAGVAVAASVRWDNDDRFGGKATWRIAPTWTIPATGTQLKATVGTGFKAPTLTQLFVSFPSFNFFANPALKPETSTGYDLGFEQPLDRGRLRLGATWFHDVIRNLITSNADFTSYANFGRATTYGVESFISATVSDRLKVRADYTWTVARDDIAEDDLLRRPRHKASAQATWRATDRLSVTGSVLYVGGWVDGNRDFSIQRLNASPHATVNIAGSYDLPHGVTLFARVNNLLDRHYQDPVGFDRPGIGAFGGVKVTLP
jgi:vitamin B12 transporter